MCSYSIRVGFNSWRTNFVQPLSLVSDDKDIFYSIQIYFSTFCLLLKPVIVLQSIFFFFIFGELYIIGWLIMWTCSIGIGFVLFCFPQLLLLYVSSIYTDSCIFLSGGRALSSSFSFCWSLRCPAQICGNGDFDHEKTVASQKHPAATGLEHCWGWGTFTHSEWRAWIKLPSGLSSSLQFSHV